MLSITTKIITENGALVVPLSPDGAAGKFTLPPEYVRLGMKAGDTVAVRINLSPVHVVTEPVVAPAAPAPAAPEPAPAEPAEHTPAA